METAVCRTATATAHDAKVLISPGNRRDMTHDADAETMAETYHAPLRRDLSLCALSCM